MSPSARPVLIASLVSQAIVTVLFFASSIGFLWYNVVGTVVVVALALLLELLGLGGPRVEIRSR